MKKILLVVISALLFGCGNNPDYAMENVSHVVEMCTAHEGVNRFHMNTFTTQWIYHVTCNDRIQMTKVVERSTKK